MKTEFSKIVLADEEKIAKDEETGSILDKAVIEILERKNAKFEEEAEKAQNVIELYELQKEALAKQLDEAKKRIAELEAAQE